MERMQLFFCFQNNNFASFRQKRGLAGSSLRFSYLFRFRLSHPTRTQCIPTQAASQMMLLQTTFRAQNVAPNKDDTHSINLLSLEKF